MASRVFVFFNCDAEKSQSSMNIFYNDATYKDTPISRRRLFRKIEAERKSGRIQIAEENLAKIEQAVMKGNPSDASQFITYGAVKELKCF